jgi:hypothetical protein
MLPSIVGLRHLPSRLPAYVSAELSCLARLGPSIADSLGSQTLGFFVFGHNMVPIIISSLLSHRAALSLLRVFARSTSFASFASFLLIRPLWMPYAVLHLILID